MAYESLINDPERLSGQQRHVFLCLAARGDSTRQELSAATHLPINIITPRVKELLDQGFIRVVGTRACLVTGHTAQVLRVNGGG